jgi:hypothetical protein
LYTVSLFALFLDDVILLNKRRRKKMPSNLMISGASSLKLC